nr:hypothetical protein [Tanacetum cinerariifolium]
MAKSSSSSENEVKKEKESLDNKLTGFGNASKDLDNLLESQRSDKNKEGLGYSAVPLPPAQIDSPPKKYLSWTGLLEFVDDAVTDYRSIMSKPMIKFVKEADCPRVIKINNTENARKSTVKYAEMYMNILKGPKGRENQQNWNNLKSQQFGKGFLMQNKACFKCGYFDHLRSFQRKSTVKNQPRVPKVSIVTEKIPTVDSKFPTAKSTVTADLGDKGKDVKASACWIWRPKQNTSKQGPNCNGVSVTLKKYQYIDTQGRLKHMTGNISYLFEYAPYDGGYVSFDTKVKRLL